MPCTLSAGVTAAPRTSRPVSGREGAGAKPTGAAHRENPEVGGLPHGRTPGHQIRAVSRILCCGDSHDATAQPNVFKLPQHKTDRNICRAKGIVVEGLHSFVVDAVQSYFVPCFQQSRHDPGIGLHHAARHVEAALRAELLQEAGKIPDTAAPINLSLLTPCFLLSVLSCSIPAWPGWR